MRTQEPSTLWIWLWWWLPWCEFVKETACLLQSLLRSLAFKMLSGTLIYERETNWQTWTWQSLIFHTCKQRPWQAVTCCIDLSITLTCESKENFKASYRQLLLENSTLLVSQLSWKMWTYNHCWTDPCSPVSLWSFANHSFARFFVIPLIRESNWFFWSWIRFYKICLQSAKIIPTKRKEVLRHNA